MSKKINRFKVVMHKETGDLAELQEKSFFGAVIWLMDYETIKPHTLAVPPFLLYDDSSEFQNFILLGDL